MKLPDQREFYQFLTHITKLTTWMRVPVLPHCDQLKPLSAFLIFANLIGKRCYLIVLICVSLILELDISCVYWTSLFLCELSLSFAYFPNGMFSCSCNDLYHL